VRGGDRAITPDSHHAQALPAGPRAISDSMNCSISSASTVRSLPDRPVVDPLTSASGSAQPQRDRPAVKPRALGGRLSGLLRSSERSVASWGVWGLILVSCPWQAGARLIV